MSRDEAFLETRRKICERLVKEITERRKRVLMISNQTVKMLAEASLQLTCSDWPIGSRDFTFQKTYRVAFADFSGEPPDLQIRHVHAILRQALLDYRCPPKGRPIYITLFNGNSPIAVSAFEGFTRSMHLLQGGDPIAALFRWEKKRLVECKACDGTSIHELYGVSTNVLYSLMNEDETDEELIAARKGKHVEHVTLPKTPGLIGDPAPVGCRKCFEERKPHWNCCHAAVANGTTPGVLAEGSSLKCCAPWNLPPSRTGGRR